MAAASSGHEAATHENPARWAGVGASASPKSMRLVGIQERLRRQYRLDVGLYGIVETAAHEGRADLPLEAKPGIENRESRIAEAAQSAIPIVNPTA